MGTWASYNLGNDGACDFRDDVVQHILKTAIPPKDALEIDEVMSAVEIVLAIWQRCGVSGTVCEFDAQALREKVLEVFDAESPDYYADPAYRRERRAVIVRTFEEFQTRQFQTAGTRLPKAIWVVAYLISPALPFVCLRVERAISTLQCVFAVVAALLAHIGLVSVLGNTNGNPLQIFIELLLGASLYLLILWQYIAGHSASLWSAKAERHWKIAGRLFGTILALGLTSAILTFHFPTR